MEQQKVIVANRLDYVDLAKGVMILLVVSGHILQCNVMDYKSNGIFSFIYSFHMPLFFLLSGFVMGVTRQKLQSTPFIVWLCSKIQTLFIPFLVWSLIVYKYIDPVSHSSLNVDAVIQLFASPDNGVWFLLSLFCIQIICYPVFRFKNVLWWSIPLAFITIGTLLGGSFAYCNIFHYTSFLLGYLFYSNQKLIFNHYVASASLILFILAELLYPNPLLCTLTSGICLLYICKSLPYNGGGVF